MDAGKKCHISFEAHARTIENLNAAIELFIRCSEHFDKDFNENEKLQLNLIQKALVDELQFHLAVLDLEIGNGGKKVKVVL